MDIDWSQAPEGYPIWIEDLKPHIGGDLGGWHRDDGDRYTDEHDLHWGKPEMGDYRAHRPPQPESDGAQVQP